MKIKPDNLRAANKIAHLKETSPSAAKKNYWNGVHRLVTIGNNLVLKTQDGSIWVEWWMPVEGTPIEIDTIIQNDCFDHAARNLS